MFQKGISMWHKRKRKYRDVAFGAIVQTLVIAVVLIIGYSMTDRTHAPGVTGCTKQDALAALSVIVDDIGNLAYTPKLAPPPTKPVITPRG